MYFKIVYIMSYLHSFHFQYIQYILCLFLSKINKRLFQKKSAFNFNCKTPVLWLIVHKYSENCS